MTSAMQRALVVGAGIGGLAAAAALGQRGIARQRQTSTSASRRDGAADLLRTR